MRTKKFNWALNLLTLVAMSLALVVAPVSADPEAPVDVVNVEVHVDPANAKAGAHFVFVFQITTPVPLSGEFWAQFPDVYWTPGVGVGEVDQIDLLGNAPLEVANVAWSTDQVLGHGKVITDDLSMYPELLGADQSIPPDGMNTMLTQMWIPDGQVRLTIDDTHGTTQLPAGTWVRIDFWGPANMNPGRDNAGIVNPDEEGTYSFCNATDEEQELVCVEVVIDPPLPVRLYRKRVVPVVNSNYTRLEYIAGFETIWEALLAANQVWNNQDPYDDEPWWNLFETCPDFSDWCEYRDECSPAELAFLNEVNKYFKEVAVGAVIEVDADADSDGVADVYTNTHAGLAVGGLDMDTPGLILGSLANEDTGVQRAVIEANALDSENAVNILAGGITLGASDIVVGTDAYGEPDEWKNLNGFEIRNAGDATPPTDGVYVALTSGDCIGTLVYSSTVEGSGILTNTVLDQGGMNITFDATNNASIVNAINGCSFNNAKIANLTSGWSAHVSSWTSPRATIDISATGTFTDGDAVAIFCSGDYVCTDARVDIRDNIIHDNTKNGIEVYSASIWVDSNEVFNNDQDGFYGVALKCCGVAVCDGIDRTDKMLEISNNNLHDNGDGTDGGYIGDDNCFDPNGAGDDAGIQIVSTSAAACAEMITDTLYIHDNLISANSQAGIWLDENSTNCGIRILWNEILNNGIFGVSSYAWDFGRIDGDFEQPTTKAEIDVIFKYNDVYGNYFWGVKNWQDRNVWLFNAKENYWGMHGEMVEPSGGPSHGPKSCLHEWDEDSEAQGYGDAVSKAVFYNPWLSVPSGLLLVSPTEGGYQGFRAYGSDSLKLQAGWNTLAVPLPLDAGANELAEIAGLGTFMWEGEDAKWELAYQYDNETGAWGAIDDPSVPIEAVHGYFVKISPDIAPDGTKFPVIYGKTLIGLPAYDLVAGWNLIGSAFGIDRFGYDTDPDQGRWAIADPDDCDWTPQGKCEAEAYKAVSVTLESIIDWTGQGGLSMIVDPPMPGQINKGWPAPALTVQQAANEVMATGEAYWVYMKTPGALAGFEIAPLFFEGDPPLPAK